MIFDLSNTVNLQLLSSFNAVQDIQHFVIDGDIAYLADSKFGVRILDISDKKNPISISEISLQENVSFQISEVQLFGDFLFVGRPSITGLLTILDVSNPTIPKIAFNPEFGYVYSSFAVSDDILVLTDSDAGIRIYDRTDFSDIVYLRPFDPLPEGGSVFSEQFTFQVYLRDRVAILNDYQAGISTVNITGT